VSAATEGLPGSAATFGAGGSEPYARALRSDDENPLYLLEVLPEAAPRSTTMDFARWNDAADQVDLHLLASVLGPVLDIGCGPGRMVQAALDLGLDALGIDVSSTVVELARHHGLPVFEGSVFERLPNEGGWQTVLLVDGNVGIGGDVDALLDRCHELLTPTGEIVVELHPDNDRDRTYTCRLVDSGGGHSEPFPWAEIGLTRITERAFLRGFALRQAWSSEDRSFCRLAKSRA
jgi:SAM-dependent methyltransferase